MLLSGLFDLNVAFDGWAIAIIIFLLSLGFGAYKLASKTKVTQRQVSREDADQNQEIRETTIKERNRLKQTQKAGNKSKQNQKA